jgi:hypothetical protein
MLGYGSCDITHEGDGARMAVVAVTVPANGDEALAGCGQLYAAP